MGPSGEYWLTRENMEQRGKILDRQEKYSIETEQCWAEIGNMRQGREIRVGDEK